MKRPGRWRARVMGQRFGQALLAPNARFRVQKWTISSRVWEDRAPFRIAILSDLHWGYRTVTERSFAAVKRRVMAISPDMVVFLGDLAEGFGTRAKAANVARGAAALEGLSAPFGCYAVLGNHDWEDDAEAQARRAGPVAAAGHLEAAGFRVLQNAALRPGRDDVWLAGLDSQQAFKRQRAEGVPLGADDLSATLAAAPGDDPIILLAHEPDIFPDIDDPRVVLTLSGHMHAGQIRPFGRAIVAPSRHGTRYAYGLFTNDTRHLVVSGGLGCTGLPLRIGIVPEITLVEISGA